MKFFKVFFIFLFFCFSFYEGQQLPKETYYQFSYHRNVEYKNDTITIRVENPLSCPLRIRVFSDYLKSENFIDDTLNIMVNENSFAEIRIFANNIDVEKVKFNINQAFGDVHKIIKQNNLALPFPKGKTYNIMQSNKGSFSHNDDYNKYAVDFDMKTGDTITSADDGFVVGVIKDYEFGKDDKKWTPYSNYITIYHSESGLFTQYVH